MIATQEALARLKTSDVSKDLTSFLDNFQTTVNQGFAFLKEKITDPESGLETRVETLETLVNKKEAGLFDRVGKIESAITDEQGTSRIEKLENAVKKGLNSNSIAGAGAPQYVIANKEEARLVNQLITKTNDLEKRMGEIEFKNSVLTNWADTMFQDHHSLQRQVNFNTSKHHANEVIVGGIYEAKKQDCKRASIQFFRSKLGIQVADTEILHARRVGKHGRTIEVTDTDETGAVFKKLVQCPRHMVVKCTPVLRYMLLEKKKLLSGLVDPKGFKYFVARYLPEAFKAAHSKHREELTNIYTANQNKLPKNRTNA